MYNKYILKYALIGPKSMILNIEGHSIVPVALLFVSTSTFYWPFFAFTHLVLTELSFVALRMTTFPPNRIVTLGYTEIDPLYVTQTPQWDTILQCYSKLGVNHCGSLNKICLINAKKAYFSLIHHIGAVKPLTTSVWVMHYVFAFSLIWPICIIHYSI